jgi:hypothetical protein
MQTAAELRAEAARMREFALSITDREVREEIQAMIKELGRRARTLENSGACGYNVLAILRRYPIDGVALSAT